MDGFCMLMSVRYTTYFTQDIGISIMSSRTDDGVNKFTLYIIWMELWYANEKQFSKIVQHKTYSVTVFYYDGKQHLRMSNFI